MTNNPPRRTRTAQRHRGMTPQEIEAAEDARWAILKWWTVGGFIVVVVLAAMHIVGVGL